MDASGQPEATVLLVDDDEEEYIVVRKYLKSARKGAFRVEWVPTFDEALNAMAETSFDVCLLDYHLGAQTGIELLSRMRALDYDLPVILLTGRASLELDLEAMETGAFDFLEKGDLTPVLLERSIRYTIENHRARVALRKANEELERRVRERTAELNRSNQALEQFANIVARDLQEPLHAIARHIEAVRARETADGEKREQGLAANALDPILHAVRNMELMVQNVLDSSRAGKKAKDFELVELSPVIERACADLEPRIRETGAAVNVGPMPAVKADPTMLKGLFENLLDNAIKFRGEAPLQIDITSERRGAAWVCAVKDNGSGLSAEDVDDVFLMFHRGSQEPSQPGIGIGLAMCRKIIQHHGGTIWADSETGEGTTIFFTFPAA
jgi:two-component system, sensor histidine kinase and response regulator